MRIIFMGTPDFAVGTLQAIAGKQPYYFCNMIYSLFSASYSSAIDCCSPYAEISAATDISFVMIAVFFTFEQSWASVRLHEDMQSAGIVLLLMGVLR